VYIFLTNSLNEMFSSVSKLKFDIFYVATVTAAAVATFFANNDTLTD